MKNLIRIVPFVLILAMLSACEKESKCIRGNGNIVSRTYSIADFNKLAIHGKTQIFITKGETNLRIEGDENILKVLDVSTTSGELSIGEDNCFKDIEALKIYVSTNTLNGIYCAGLSDVITQDNFISSVFNVEISGTSTMDLDIDAQEFNTTISGIGNVTARGTALTQTIAISGRGDLKYFELENVNSDIHIDGKGDIELNVSTSLKVDIRGTGNIYYRGNPKVIKNISGSGLIVPNAELHQ